MAKKKTTTSKTSKTGKTSKTRETKSSRRAGQDKRKAAAGSKRPAALPRFRAFLAVSLDGYIADWRGGVGWLDPYFTPEIDFPAFWRTIGAAVMGRKTYDWTEANDYIVEVKGRCIVQTHRPLRNARDGIEAFSGDVRTLAAELRSELAGTGKDVCLFGGGESLASFHSHGLVDRWELAIIPTLLGGGTPLFPKQSRRGERLRLTHTRPLENGVIEVWYEPERPTPAARARRTARARR